MLLPSLIDFIADLSRRCSFCTDDRHLADTLERLAATLRDRAELELKVQAKTSEARASIKIVACLVPGVLAYMYVQAPGDFEFLVTDPTGLKVLGYAAVSVALGLLVTWLMVRRIQ